MLGRQRNARRASRQTVLRFRLPTLCKSPGNVTVGGMEKRENQAAHLRRAGGTPALQLHFGFSNSSTSRRSTSISARSTQAGTVVAPPPPCPPPSAAEGREEAGGRSFSA